SISASGLAAPSGLAFDQQDNLYVADLNNTRVLKFAAPQKTGQDAIVVYGEANFTTRGVPPTPSASSMSQPVGLALDTAGNLFVAVPNENRVLKFAAGSASGAAAAEVIGQPSFSTI